MMSGSAPVATHPIRKIDRKPSPVAAINRARIFQVIAEFKPIASATISPTGRKASVKAMPRAITIPEAAASMVPANVGR